MTSSAALLKDPQGGRNDLTSTLTPGEARRRFVPNVASNVAYIFAASIAGLWFTPFLIANLGIEVYGLVPLVTSVVAYMTLFSGGLDTAIGRFLLIDLSRSDEVSANRTFNTALLGLTGIALALLPVVVAAAWLFPTVFNIPEGFESEARLLLGFSALAFLLTMIGSSFTVSTVAFHRFDLKNLVQGARIVVRVGIVILLFKLFSRQVWHVGFAMLAAASVSFAGYWLLWRRLTPQLHIRPHDFDRARFGELMSMGGWAVLNNTGLLLLLGIDLIVVNAFFGSEMTGRYGSLLLFPMLIVTLASAVSSVLKPIITSQYAVRDFDGMRRFVPRAVRLMAIGIALPIALLCAFARPLLGIWLGPEFENLDILLIVLVGPLTISLATLPLRAVLSSHNKLRLQGIVTVVFGVIGLFLAIALASWGQWEAIGVAVATTTVWTARNLFFVTGYSAHVMNIHWSALGRGLLAGAVGTLAVGLAGYGLTRIWWPENWISLGAMAIVVSLAYGLAVYLFGLSKLDRQLLSDLIGGPFRRSRARRAGPVRW